jgi:hypothetical protein
VAEVGRKSRSPHLVERVLDFFNLAISASLDVGILATIWSAVDHASIAGPESLEAVGAEFVH